MQTRIQGTVMPVLEVRLDPNESIFAESGELSWMTSSIQMSTHTQMGGGGGLFGALKRVVGGGTLFMTEYKAAGATGEVAFDEETEVVKRPRPPAFYRARSSREK